jgi:two-component system cell cycle sensor histidine kinase/response regulator CckA
MQRSADGSDLAESELLHQLKQLVTHLDAVLWLTPPDKSEMTFVSAGFERIFGVPPSALRERPALLFELIHPDDRERMREAMAEQGKGEWERRYRIVRQDGLRWLRARAFPVHDREGRLTQIAGITEDITAQVAAENALAQSRQRFEALTEHSGVGIWEIDRQGFTTYLNRAMRSQLELADTETLASETYHQFFTPESLATMRREHAKRGAGLPSSYQVEIVGRKGGRRQVMVNGAPVVSPSGEVQGLIGTFSDVSEVRRLEQALGQSQKLEAIGQLAAGVAHDFNNLLIPILGYSEMAIEALGDSQIAEDLQAVMQAGQQAKELTSQLLAFARKQALDMRPLALGSQVSGFAPVLRRMLRENVTLDMSVEEDARLIQADATQIRQVLLNLTSNAQDAMPDGGRLHIRVRLVVLGEEDASGDGPLPPGAYVELSVADSGVGMDAATQARIFEPFFTTKSAEAGTGLGLAMVYGCVRQHGGRIRCSSMAGCGTTFTLLFPTLERTEPEPQALLSAPPLRAHADTILLVEDQEAVRRLVARVLASEGYNVVEAADGREALERAAKHAGKIGLLVSDVIMPNMGGYELLAKLRQQNHEMRALFLSGYSENSGNAPTRLEAHFLPKPFAVDALKRVVRQVLAS